MVVTDHTSMNMRFVLPLLLAALGVGTSYAESRLVYYYDFEKITGGDGGVAGDASAVNHNLAPSPGTGRWVESNPDLWVGWTGGALNSTYAFNCPTGGSKLTLTGTGENGSLGVNAADGFTLSFHIKDTGAAQWAKMFQLNTSSGNNIYAKKVLGSASEPGASQIGVNGDNLGLDNWADFTAPKDAFMHLAFTFQNGTLTGYKNGIRFLSAENLAFTGELTSINLAPAGGAAFDEVSLYSGVLTSGEIAYLTTHQLLPEPSTACLDLLGLAIFSLRRKRQLR